MYDYPAQSPAKQGPLNDAEYQSQTSASDRFTSPILQNQQQQQQNQQPYPPQQNQQYQYQQDHLRNQGQVQYVAQYAAYQPMIQPTVVYIQDNTQKLALPMQLDNYSAPVFFHCTQCNHDSISLYKVEPGGCTYICGCFLCCITGILCPLPFLLDNCQDKFHFCSVCGAQVGRKEFKVLC